MLLSLSRPLPAAQRITRNTTTVRLGTHGGAAQPKRMRVPTANNRVPCKHRGQSLPQSLPAAALPPHLEAWCQEPLHARNTHNSTINHV